ncbi:MAG: PhzF family phenazine biosynthesis protein [Acidimicrobiia bacterium]
MPRHCYVLRVFTRDGAGGNGLGVVTDTLGLDDHKMQLIASDLGFSETVYLKWFEGSMPKARIFTPKTEIPFAGHPLVGAAWVLINLGPVDPGGIECVIGPVRIRQTGPDTWVDAPAGQPVREIQPTLDPSITALEAVEVLMPSPYKLIQLGSPDEVAAVGPATMGGLGDVYVWAWEREGEVVRSRFFAPDFGIEEDPATGSAAVALAARMRARGAGRGSVLINQGAETGYPSRIQLTWDDSTTSIGGTVVKDEVRFLKL